MKMGKRYVLCMMATMLCMLPLSADTNELRNAAGTTLRFPEVSGRHVLIVGASESFPTGILETACSRIILMTRMPVKWDVAPAEGESAIGLARKLLGCDNVAAVVVMAESPDAPSLVAMPEQRIVVLNPVAWSSGCAGPGIFEKRSVKMVERGFCAVMGATLAPVFTMEDLDKLRSGIAPSVITSVFRYGKALGLEPMRPVQ